MKRFNLLKKSLLAVVLVACMMIGVENVFAGPVQNPMNSNLDAATYDITGIGSITATDITVTDIIAKGPFVDCDAYATFAAAITDISTDEKTLLISSSESVTGNVTVPTNVNLLFLKGGELAIATATTVNINGTIAAGPYKIFALTGTADANLDDAIVSEVYPEWWGAKGDDSTDDYNAISEAIDTGQAVKFQRATYRFGSTITLPTGGVMLGAGGVTGYGTILRPTNGTFTGATINVEGNCTVRAIHLDGDLVLSNNIAGMEVGDAALTSQTVLDQVSIYNFDQGGQSGLFIQNVVGCYIYDIYIKDNTIGVKIHGDSSLPTCINFYGGNIRESLKSGVLIEQGWNITFNGTVFEACQEDGVRIEPPSSHVVFKVHFTDCWFEGNWNGDPNNYHLTADGTAGAIEGVTLDNCYPKFHSR